MCDLVSDLKVFFLFPQGFLQGCVRQGDANLWLHRLSVQWMSSKSYLTEHNPNPNSTHGWRTSWFLSGFMSTSGCFKVRCATLCFMKAYWSVYWLGRSYSLFLHLWTLCIMWALKDMQRSNFMALRPRTALVNQIIQAQAMFQWKDNGMDFCNKVINKIK